VIEILYHMPIDIFLDFRRYLDTASGRQSKQFYILKTLLGFKFALELPFLKVEDRHAVHAYTGKRTLFDFYKDAFSIEQADSEDALRAAFGQLVAEKPEAKAVLLSIR
jgi:tryptophan 2,3-dioxygenase